MKKHLAALSAALLIATALSATAGTPAEAASKANITMTITSSTGSDADISWYSDGNSATLRGHATPYTRTVSTSGYSHSIRASNYGDEEVSLSCVIKYKGKVKVRHTVRGTSVNVSCDWSL